MALTQKITLDTSQFKQGMDECKSSVSSANSEIQKQTKGVTDLAAATHAASAKTTNYRRQFMELQRQLQSMLINYRALSDEEKNSDFGKKLSRQIDELTVKAADWKDSLGDMQAAITAASSDTLKWDAMNEGLDIAKTSLESFVSLTGLADTESEKFKQTIATLTKIETTFNAVIKITNALQKNSSLMLQITALQARARKAAEASVTGELVKQTVAQKALNAVAKANPYVLIGTALVGICAAVATFTGILNKNTDELEDNTDAIDKSAEEHKKYIDTLTSNSSSLLASFSKLQVEWNNLKTTAEKTEYIKQNADEFNKLGIKIEDLNDAENVFNKNSEAVIRAIMARAQAAAYAAKQEELWSKWISLRDSLERGKVKAGDKMQSSDIDRYGLVEGKDYTQDKSKIGAYFYTVEGAAKKNADAAKKGLASVEEEIKETAKLQADASRQTQQILAAAGIKGYSKGDKGSDTQKQTKETKQDKPFTPDKSLDPIGISLDSLATYEKQIKRLQDARKNATSLFDVQEIDSQIEKIKNKMKLLEEGPTVEIKIDLDTNLVQEAIEEEADNAVRAAQEKADKISGTLQGIGDVVGTTGQAFSALGDLIGGDVGKGFDVAGIIAQTLANVALSFSQAMSNPATSAGGIWTWLPASIAGLAQLIVMTTQIKAATKNANGGILGYADGGVLQMPSMVGDNNFVLSRVNGGEMVLNTAQQTKLFGILNGTNSILNTTSQSGGEVNFKIRGTELQGVLKNTTNKQSKI